MDENEMQKGHDPDFSLGAGDDGEDGDPPRILKMASPLSRAPKNRLNRRHFLRGALTAGTGLAGLAATIGSSDDTGIIDGAYEKQCSVEQYPAHSFSVCSVAYSP